MLSHFIYHRIQPILWAAASQAPLSMGLSRQEYWSALPCPPPGDLPDPGIQPMSLTSALSEGFFATSTTWQTHYFVLTGFPKASGFLLFIKPDSI